MSVHPSLKALTGIRTAQKKAASSLDKGGEVEPEKQQCYSFENATGRRLFWMSKRSFERSTAELKTAVCSNAAGTDAVSLQKWSQIRRIQGGGEMP